MAAEEEPKGAFPATRRLLQEAKSAARLADHPAALLTACNEVLTYCRLNTVRKEPPSSSSAAKPMPAKPLPGPKKKPLPQLSDAKMSRQSMGPVLQQQQKVSSLAPKPASEKRPASVGYESGVKSNDNNAKGTKVKASNPNALARDGSFKGNDKLSEKERLQAALENKKPMKKLGKLQKEGGGKSLLGRKNWKERLFELSDSSVEYYKESNETEKPLGAISLYEVTQARRADVQGRSYCFEIVTASRNFQCQASSDADASEWIKAINNNVDRQKLIKKILSLP